LPATVANLSTARCRTPDQFAPRPAGHLILALALSRRSPDICRREPARTERSPTRSGPEGSSRNDFAPGRAGSHRFARETWYLRLWRQDHGAGRI